MAKKKAKKKFVYELHDGTRYAVTGEDGKFLFCEDAEGKPTQFRKAAWRGVLREETAEAENKEE